ncbi:S-adenosyl-L-methionine-dependent methyltransferase [Lepidopterella palustris CBS 459.81]|uniref:S-adenosyl-L-methionine-dependent methyltransferase n=1 Tax=Lepidopterella palustris CBS 459.81 TaxID=1314670 RepID=A0A8E2DX43_9PEZI|nr:S-adenosyl-L-methionine-dependent methyltransferase [Lepidopterella palustris CBS 459.81]
MSANGDAWSANAKAYANLPKDKEGPHIAPSAALLKRMDEALPISQATAILDVGCGPGTTIGMLIEQYHLQIPPEARLIASDFSAGMVEQVQERKKREAGNSTWEGLETIVADAQDLSGIEDASISHVMGSLVYNLLPERREALAAAYRVLKPGGVLCTATWVSVEWMDLMGLAAKIVRPNSGPKFTFPADWGSTEAIQAEFEAVGLNNVHVEYANAFMGVDDPSPFINGFIRGNNPGTLFYVGGYSADELDRFCEQWLKLVKERHPESPRKLKGVFCVSIGRK